VSQTFVVVNPAAGGGRTARLWPALRDDLQRLGLAFDWTATTARGEAMRLARAAVTAGARLVVAVGGDGTLNEVVNGVVGDVERRVTVGAILTGRGRDGARNFGLAAEPRRAARRLVDGDEVAFDLVGVEWPDGARRWALGAAGAGFDGAVAQRTATGGGVGTLPYLAAVVTTLSTHRSVTTTIDADAERVWSGPLSAVVVANGAYFGGGMQIAPGADAGDGQLDLVVLGDLRRHELLLWLPTVYWGGHLANRKVLTRRVRRVTLGAGPLPMHVDGEPVPAAPATLTVAPGALRLRR
jgi:diacylglycerol kinase (ATP)